MLGVFAFLHLVLPLSSVQPLPLERTLFLREMSIRNGFKKKRLMRRDDSTHITMWLLCKVWINYTDNGG